MSRSKPAYYDDERRDGPVIIKCWSCGAKHETFFVFKRCRECQETIEVLVEERRNRHEINALA